MLTWFDCTEARSFYSRLLRLLLVLSTVCAMLLLATNVARAENLRIIRDAETENLVRELAEPILVAAGLSPKAVNLILVDNDSVNAFVMGGDNIFIYTGLLFEAKTVRELQGVIAHETGHIAAGHLGRLKDQVDLARAKGFAALAIGLGAAVLSKNGELANAAVVAGQDIVLSDILSFTRSQESQADQLAVDYLGRAGLSAKGLSSFLGTLQKQDYLVGSDSYWRTHPLSRERIAMLEDNINASNSKNNPTSFDQEQRYQRVRAKLMGFLKPARQVESAYPKSDASLPARYAQAISAYKHKGISPALDVLLPLLEQYPNDPYMNELLGQITLEYGFIDDAIFYYSKADALRPNDPIIQASYAAALIQKKQPSSLQTAVSLLNRALVDADEINYWRLLALAQNGLGQQALAALAQAEASLRAKDMISARNYAEQVMTLSAEKSPEWYRANQIKAIAQNKKS